MARSRLYQSRLLEVNSKYSFESSFVWKFHKIYMRPLGEHTSAPLRPLNSSKMRSTSSAISNISFSASFAILCSIQNGKQCWELHNLLRNVAKFLCNFRNRISHSFFNSSFQFLPYCWSCTRQSVGIPVGDPDPSQGRGRKDARSLRAVQVRSVEQVHAQAIHSRWTRGILKQ